jgi:hypothetical protein
MKLVPRVGHRLLGAVRKCSKGGVKYSHRRKESEHLNVAL